MLHMVYFEVRFSFILISIFLRGSFVYSLRECVPFSFFGVFPAVLVYFFRFLCFKLQLWTLVEGIIIFRGYSTSKLVIIRFLQQPLKIKKIFLCNKLSGIFHLKAVFCIKVKLRATKTSNLNLIFLQQKINFQCKI